MAQHRDTEWKMSRLGPLVLLGLLAFASPLVQAAPAGAGGASPELEAPNPEAFLGWKSDIRFAGETIPLSQLRDKKVVCKDDRLFPTHPSQTLKRYHQIDVGTYDIFKLEAEDEACLIKGKVKNNKGIFPCFNADIAERNILSDTYRDACGNQYRGVVKRVFLRKQDNMGTLFSPGRSMVPDVKSEIAGEFLIAGTYAVELKSFLRITELLPGDEAKILAEQEQAAKDGFRFDPATFLYSR